jgi:hypothetical protein
MALAPGNGARLHEFHHHIDFFTVFASFKEGWVAAFLMIWRLIAGNYKPLLIGGLAAYYWGSLISPVLQGQHPKVSHALVWKCGSVAVASLILANFLLLFPAMVLGGGLPPDRSWAMNMVFSAVILFLFAGFLGFAFPVRKKALNHALAILLGVAVLVHASYRVSVFTRQYRDLSAYASAFDERGKLLLQLKSEGRQTPLTLKPLPSTDVFNIDYDAPTVERLYGLPFHLSEDRQP